MDQTEQFADLARRFLLKDLHNVSLNLGKEGDNFVLDLKLCHRDQSVASILAKMFEVPVLRTDSC